MSKEELHEVYDASLLHDCGVSSTQTHKYLVSELDWSNSEEHCIRGHDLLEKQVLVSNVSPIVRYHHTHWDTLQTKNIPYNTALISNCIYMTDRVEALISQEIFMEVEPLAGKRHVAVTEHRTKKDWAMQIKQMLDERYSGATKVRLVMDNLNTHTIASLYETFEPKEARRLAERLDIHYTPKHASWLNMAEIELSVLKGQCLDRRIPDMVTMQAEVAAWERDRNNSARKILWQFTTSDARIKLKRLYPKL